MHVNLCMPASNTLRSVLSEEGSVTNNRKRGALQITGRGQVVQKMEKRMNKIGNQKTAVKLHVAVCGPKIFLS